jgi:hypothetical protein
MVSEWPERAAGQKTFDIGRPGQHVLGLRQQRTAGAVQMQRFADAVEQGAVELPLQFNQCTAGG